MWKLLKYSFLSVAALLVLCAGAWLLTFRTPLVKNRVEAMLNRELAGKTKIQFAIGNMSGNGFTEIILESIVLTVPQREGIDTLAVVPRLVVSYELSEIFADPIRVRRVIIDQPQILLPDDSVITYARSLMMESAPSDASVADPIDFLLDSVIIRNGLIRVLGQSSSEADSIDLIVAVKRDGEGTYLNLTSSTAHLARLGHVSFDADCRWWEGQLVVRSAHLKTDRSQIDLSGDSDLWTIRTSPLDLADLHSLWSKEVTGRIDFEGTIVPGETWTSGRIVGSASGRVGRFAFEDLSARLFATDGIITAESVRGKFAGAHWHGRGDFDWLRSPFQWSYDGTVRHFDLQEFALGTFASDLTGRVFLDGRGITGQTLAISADVELSSGSLDRFLFDSLRGALSVTTDAIVFDEHFMVSLRETRLLGSGRIDYRGSLDVVAGFSCSDLSAWDDAVFVDSLAGRGTGFVYFKGPTINPDLSGILNSDSLRTYDLVTGDFEGRFNLPHFLHDPTGTVNARWGRTSTWGVDTDSITLHGELTGQRLKIVSGRWSSPVVQLEGAGILDWSSLPIPVSLFPLTARWEGRDYTASDTVRLAFDRDGLSVDTLQFEGPLGELDLAGRYEYGGAMHWQFALRHFEMEALLQRFAPDVGLRGIIDAEGTIDGVTDAPRFQVAGHIAALHYNGRPYGDVAASVQYADQRLIVDRLRLENDDFQIDVAGSFPVDLRFAPVAQRVLDAPLKGRLTASGEVLDRIAAFQPDLLESISGPFAVSATLGGTPREPWFSGEAHLRAGRIKLMEFTEPLENAQVDLSLRQDTIVIKRATAKIRDGKYKGEVDISGSLRIVSYDQLDYDLTIHGKSVPARFEFTDWFVAADFDITVRGKTPPLVSGRIRPTRIDDREPFSADEDLRVEDTTLWDWDLTIEVPGNYWIHNGQIEAELSAQLGLLRQRGLTNFVGEAEIIRGKVYFFDKVGRIERGTLLFDDPDKPDPTLDIDVVFRIHQPRVAQAGASGSSTSEMIDLRLHVAGRASEPLIQPEPPYTEEDALLLLTANMTAASAGDPLANRLRFAATGLVFSEVQRVVARRLGLETLEIESGLDPADTRITVGRYVSPQIYLYGTSPIASGTGQEVGFEYRFSRRMFMEGNRDRYNNYRLNLHLKWDY